MKSLPRFLPPLLFFLLLAILAFRAAWPEGQVIQASDFNAGLIGSYQKVFPGDWFTGTWSASVALGGWSARSINLTNLLIAVLPHEFACDALYAIHLLIASLAFTAFLRRLGLGLPAAAFGSLTAFWLASNLTLVYPGHLYKYGVLSCCALFLWLWEKALQTRKAGAFLLAGGAFGMMFLEQQDVALFCALMAGPHALWRLWRAKPSAGLGVLFAALAAVPALLLLSEAYFKARATFIEPAAITQKSVKQKWDWATQWSWPPGETIEFVAPGFRGIRTGLEGADYWGEMGRSWDPDWNTKKEGLRNLKNESQYIGAVPMGFALLAALLAFLPASRGAESRGALRFWTIMALVLFGLACGRYLPLYRVFFELPQMASIRCPNKFLQPFQLAVGVLAAFGFEALLGALRERMGLAGTALARRVAWGACGAAVLLLIGWMAVLSASDRLAVDLAAEGFAEPAKLASRAASAMGHAFLMTLGFAASAWFAARLPVGGRARGLKLLQGLVFLPVLLDVYLLSGHYLVGQNLGPMRGNAVSTFLRREARDMRVYALDQGGIYGYLLTFSFPLEGVHYSNILAAPRMNSDLHEYLRAAGNNLPRQWWHFGVSHVLISVEMWNELRAAMPSWAGLLEPVMGWGLARDARTDFRMVPMTSDPQHVILRFKASPGRAWLAGAWREASPPEIRIALANPRSDMETTAWVESGGMAGLLPPSGAPALAGTVRQQRSQAGVRFEVEAQRPAMLVMADHYSPGFRALVNGSPVPLRRVNGLLMGLPVPAGASVVDISHPRPMGGVFRLLAGLGLCLGGAVSLLIQRKMP